jgi:hypothetical protein
MPSSSSDSVPLAVSPQPRPPRLPRRFSRDWIECVCAGGGGVAALLAVKATISPVASAIARHVARNPARAPRVEGYIGFVFAAACAVVGAAAAVAPLGLFERVGRRWLAPLLVLALVASLGALRAHWLAYAAPMVVLAVAPMFMGGRIRTAPWPGRDARDAIVCIASEGACLGVGLWLPFAGSVPALLLPLMTAMATLASYAVATQLRGDGRWRMVLAGLPVLALPLEGMRRNPTLIPTLVCVLLASMSAWLLFRRPAATERAVRWARRNAVTVAIPALMLFLVLPWHFRDINVADLGGHEGQHLGWINSISFGKLMMADAGFTYGPLREYILALGTWLQGGLTLEHVRVAHVLVNVLGLVCLLAAMRGVAAGQLTLLALGVLLLLTHSSLVSFVVYSSPAYSFGWADASRAGLATLAVVVVLARRLRDSRASRRSLLVGGALAAIAVLYSHDFGLPAVLGTLVGLVSEMVLRGGATFRQRARAALRSVATYGVGIAMVLVPFLAVYAVRGRLLPFFEGYAWTIQVSSSTTPFDSESWWVTSAHVSSYKALTAPYWTENKIGACVMDQLAGPALAMLGLMHVVVAIVRRRFEQRTVLVAGLSILATMTLHHAFLNADPWHAANAVTPGLVLLIALAAGARGLYARPFGGRALPIGAACAAFLPIVWLVNGAFVPLNTRLGRIASGEEQPSVGPPYQYPDLPRAGDERVTNQHLTIVRWVRAHSSPSDAVYCTTWLLGGGTEAFLSERRNPTSFDKPDEIASPRFQQRALDELQRDPPLLIVGDHFDEIGEKGRAFIAQGWHPSRDPDGNGALERNH